MCLDKTSLVFHFGHEVNVLAHEVERLVDVLPTDDEILCAAKIAAVTSELVSS